MLIIDREVLHVMAFNYTRLDIDKSRSFSVSTRNKKLVQEALKLFESDMTRQPYTAGCEDFVVSPESSRTRLAAFIKGARKQLLIYDPKLTDPMMMRLLEERRRKGVDVRILGHIGKRTSLNAAKMPGIRLHARVIIRDGNRAFVGSQSLRKAELDERREVGLITRDARSVKRLRSVFEADWAQSAAAKKGESATAAVVEEAAIAEPERAGEKSSRQADAVS
jgi:phosphatidylserine/phosphatidylglycerophosphate/cardiolipin synthase-like enzyme